MGKNITQQTAEKLYDLIVKDEHFHPGEKLPGELELSKTLKISRSTLREAIRVLASQGILEVYRGRGTFVALDVKPFGDYGLGKLEQNKLQLRDLFEVRLITEPECAALACRRGTDEEIEKIIKAGHAVQKAIHQGEPRGELDNAFHKAIVQASHNDFMVRVIPIITNGIALAIDTKYSEEQLAANTLIDHQLIMGFIRDRDAGGAKRAMYIHLHRAMSGFGLTEDI